MAYAVVASYSGFSKTTTNIGGIDYDVYTLTSLGGGSITFSSGGDVDYALIAGGATGGRNTTGSSNYAGGGGAGGVLLGTTAISSGTLSFVVGAGGAAPTAGGVGNNGGNTTGLSLTAIGGGGGAAAGNAVAPNPGGSGGGGANGAAGAQRTGAAGTPGQGYAGGTCVNGNRGAGGGGAGGVGEDNLTTTPSKGGPPISITITGTTLWVAAGGSSRGASQPTDWGGYGSGGWGTNSAVAGSWQTATPGLDGVVIIRVATPTSGVIANASISFSMSVSSAAGVPSVGTNSQFSSLMSSASAISLASSSGGVSAGFSINSMVLTQQTATASAALLTSAAVSSMASSPALTRSQVSMLLGVFSSSGSVLYAGSTYNTVSSAASSLRAVIGPYASLSLIGLTSAQSGLLSQGQGLMQLGLSQASASRALSLSTTSLVTGFSIFSQSIEMPDFHSSQYEFDGLWSSNPQVGLWLIRKEDGVFGSKNLIGLWRETR